MSDTPSAIAAKAAEFDSCPTVPQIDEMLGILSGMKRNQFVIDTENDLLELRSAVADAQ